jgi:DNA helicase HerA-like ATPase
MSTRPPAATRDHEGAGVTLFDRSRFMGTFAGLSERDKEFHAQIVVPYKTVPAQVPLHGQFVLVQLESDDEAILGRITTVASEGKLTSSDGDDYVTRAALEEREVPDDLRARYLKYRIDIRNLGILRLRDGSLMFSPSHRRMPHVGSKVALLTDDVLRFVAQASPSEDDATAAEIGFLAFGEYVYARGDKRIGTHTEDLQVLEPAVPVKFPISALISRRSMVFARAGFGKSNLMKVLLSTLYKTDPHDIIRDRKVPVGTIVFDPEGEYFWPDNRDRPALADVPELKGRLVVFTDKAPPSAAYGSFVAGPVRIDCRKVNPAKLAQIAFTAERQDQSNVQIINRTWPTDWADLVDKAAANDRNGMEAIITNHAGNNPSAIVVNAAVENVLRIVRPLHSPDSNLLDDLKRALIDGKLCVVDLSLTRGKAGNNLAGLILDHFFEHNVREFTNKDSKAIPIIAVIEEAQSVLSNDSRTGDSGPFVTWTKEGRKFGLGSVLVTQQPRSIPEELLSQADNWFVFHLLSNGDLNALHSANGHFSNDLLSSLLNEPLPGHGLAWSSVNRKPYPVSVRIVDFQALVPTLLDGEHTGAAIDTAASAIGTERARTLAQARDLAGDSDDSLTLNDAVLTAMVKHVNEKVGDALRSGNEVKWGRVQHLQKEVLIKLAIETDEDAAFERIHQERQTKTVVERIVGRTIKKNEVVNASSGGRAFRIEAQ